MPAIPRPEHVALHIGAHKTATTHLQNSIHGKRDELAARGVQFYGPHFLRGDNKTLAERFGITRRPSDPDIDNDVDTALRDLMGDGHRLVISEENFIGVLMGPQGQIQRPLYPNAAHRITQLAKRISSGGIHVHLGIRDPAAMINSGFSQALRSGKVASLEEFLRLNPINSIDWVHLVDRLRNAPGLANLTVWRHEDYNLLFRTICAGLLGEDCADLVTPFEDRMQVGLSLGAVSMLTEAAQTGSTVDVAEAVAKHPVNPEHPPFRAFDAEDHALSAEFYAAQLKEISAMKEVSLLRPTEG